MKLEDVTLDDVDELSSIKIDRRKSSNERILDFLTKVKNPYIFKVNGRSIRMRFFEKWSNSRWMFDKYVRKFI